MFDSAKKKTVQREVMIAVRAEVLELHSQGKLFLTPILMEAEPWRSFAWYAIDGKTREDTRVVDAVPLFAGGQGPGPVRLVVIDTTVDRKQFRFGRIRYKRIVQERVPGTDHIVEAPKWFDGGTDETLPHDVARQVLQREGWPVTNVASLGARTGNVVEIEWLKAEAARNDARSDTRELLAKLEARLTSAPDKQKGGPRAANVNQ